MKNALLQAAIQGKLTEQLPTDGSAKDLLGKIKPISEDEIPFDIPENWVWVKLTDIFDILNGDRGKNYPAKNKLSDIGEIPFISAINFDNGELRYDNLLFLNNKQYDLLRAGKLQENDFVVCIRGSLGKYCRYILKKGAIASSLVILRKRKSLNIIDGYIEIFLTSQLFFTQINNLKNGAAQPNLSAKNLMTFIFPLPPVAEQKRIVEKLEELLPLCDSLAE